MFGCDVVGGTMMFTLPAASVVPSAVYVPNGTTGQPGWPPGPSGPSNTTPHFFGCTLTYCVAVQVSQRR